MTAAIYVTIIGCTLSKAIDRDCTDKYADSFACSLHAHVFISVSVYV